MKKFRQLLSLILAIICLLSCLAMPASATDTSPSLPEFITDYQNGVRSFQFDTPIGYEADGTPIYRPREVTLENGETVYAVAMPLYNDVATYDGQTIELPGVAWVTARLLKSGQTATMEIVYNCFVLALATEIRVNGISTNGDLGARTYNPTLVATSIPVPYISVVKTFTGFNPYITNGSQRITVGSMTCSGVNMYGSAPSATFTFDIAQMRTF